MAALFLFLKTELSFLNANQSLAAIDKSLYHVNSCWQSLHVKANAVCTDTDCFRSAANQSTSHIVDFYIGSASNRGIYIQSSQTFRWIRIDAQSKHTVAFLNAAWRCN